MIGTDLEVACHVGGEDAVRKDGDDEVTLARLEGREQLGLPQDLERAVEVVLLEGALAAILLKARRVRFRLKVVVRAWKRTKNTNE